MLRSSSRALVDEFHAHIAARDEHLEAFRDCSNEANRNRPDDTERPAYYYGRPDPPVDFAQGVAKGVRDGLIIASGTPGPAAAKVFEKFKLIGGAIAAIGAGTTAADMVKTAQEINPDLDPYDFGRKVGELVYQGADLKDAATHAAGAAASLPGRARPGSGAQGGGGSPSAGGRFSQAGNAGNSGGGSGAGAQPGAPAVAERHDRRERRSLRTQSRCRRRQWWRRRRSTAAAPCSDGRRARNVSRRRAYVTQRR